MSINQDKIAKKDPDDDNKFIEEDSEENIDEYSLDEVFEDLRDTIIKKRISDEIHSETDEKRPYFCKLCGKKKKSYMKVKRCLNCELPICYECSSVGFCVYCWVNMTEDARKTLKVLRYLFISMPVFLLFLLYRSISEIIELGSYSFFLYFIFSEIIVISITLGLFFYSRKRILDDNSRYFEMKWLNQIKRASYLSKLDPFESNRFIEDELFNEIKNRKENSVEKLKAWITQEEEIMEPPDYLINEEAKTNDLIFRNHNPNIKNRQVKYNYIGKPCPNCEREILFADFCPDCNVRFCPSCKQENYLYTRICECSFIFNSLKEEYIEYLIQNRNKYS